jgi:hypothetical protein
LALDGRSAAPVAAFVRIMVGEFGCEVYRWEDEEEDPSRIIAWLDRLAEQNQIAPPGTPDPNCGLRN